jgi:hypothetical protein
MQMAVPSFVYRQDGFRTVFYLFDLLYHTSGWSSSEKKIDFSRSQ